jgi:hypothetical protein
MRFYANGDAPTGTKGIPGALENQHVAAWPK